MKPNDDAPVPSQNHEAHEPTRAAGERRVVCASQLKPTPPRTADDIRKLMRQGRVAEMTPRQAGCDD